MLDGLGRPRVPLPRHRLKPALDPDLPCRCDQPVPRLDARGADEKLLGRRRGMQAAEARVPEAQHLLKRVLRAAAQFGGEGIAAQHVDDVGQHGDVVADLVREGGAVAAGGQQRDGGRVGPGEQGREAAEQLERVGGAGGGEQVGGQVEGGLDGLEDEGGALGRRGRVVDEDGDVEGVGGDEQLVGVGDGKRDAVVDGEDVEERGAELALLDVEGGLVVGSGRWSEGGIADEGLTRLKTDRFGFSTVAVFSASGAASALGVYSGHFSSSMLVRACKPATTTSKK